MNIRESKDGWYIDLPNEESAGPFDDEYDAVMAARRAEQMMAPELNKLRAEECSFLRTLN